MNRRVFLGVVSGLLTPRLLQASTQPIPLRRLRLGDAQTGDTLDGPFRDDTGPVQQALAELSEFLRDHHSGERIVFDIDVLDFLASIMEAVGANEALVLSGYRTPQTNAMLARTTFGVAEHRQNMLGGALDVPLRTSAADR